MAHRKKTQCTREKFTKETYGATKSYNALGNESMVGIKQLKKKCSLG